MTIKQKKEYLTISEISKLCGVSIATLKHYDRINLLKPARVDQYNQYRYYSIHQYEQIETIRELRELGVPLAAIKEFMDHRTIEKSLGFFQQQYLDLVMKIKELSKIKNRMRTQIALMEKFIDIDEFTIRKEYFGKRKILFSDMYDLDTGTPIDDCYAILAVELLLGRNEPAATLARGRQGLLIPKEILINGDQMKSLPFIFINHKVDAKREKTLYEGDYICLMYRGDVRARKASLEILLDYIDKYHYTIVGDVVHLNLIDEAISDSPEEFIFDIQVPVQKKMDFE